MCVSVETIYDADVFYLAIDRIKVMVKRIQHRLQPYATKNVTFQFNMRYVGDLFNTFDYFFRFFLSNSK